MVQLGFGGEVGKCVCKCHRGMYRVRVHAVLPGAPPQPLGGENFNSEAEANEKLDAVVKDIAHRFLNSIGLSPDLAINATVTYGEEAVNAEQRVRNNNNPHLH